MPDGPWKKLACHRSWLASFRLARPQAQARLDPRTGQIDPASLESTILTLPVVSPYPCLGPACMLWDEKRQTCIERAMFAAQSEGAELAVAAAKREMAALAARDPEISA
ncbi:MAG: hypothetical protein Q8Q14_14790 [Gemmatimonadales bacterium]|nr:hypothetical protein [Gemmatimonadales bacterium]